MELSKDAKYALSVALVELENSGEWYDYYSEKQHEKIDRGRKELKELLKEEQ